MRPLYYKFDFETFLFVLPLRSRALDETLLGAQHSLLGEDRALVTVNDLTKKLFKCAYKASSQ